MHKVCLRICPWIILFAYSVAARGAVKLPLQGYFKPGRYFPIAVDAGDAANAITFTADRCLSTQMAAQNQPTIVPMLAVGSPTRLNWSGGSLPLQLPGDHERLIGSTRDDLTAIASLFPNQRLIPISLDAAIPLPGPPVAWESLDALFLDSRTVARIDDPHRSALLGAGTILISSGINPPDTRWPWQSSGNNLWTLSLAPAGPVNSVIVPEAYTPTFAPAPGFSINTREQIVGVGILLALSVIGLCLIKKPVAYVLAMLLCIVATAGIAHWQKSLGPITRSGGDILIFHDNLQQTDSWVFDRFRMTGTNSIAWAGETHPVFFSPRTLATTQLHLLLTPDDQLQFQYTLPPNASIAFLRRDVNKGDTATYRAEKGAVSPLLPTSPLVDLVRALYLAPGEKIAGQIQAPADRWPAVLIVPN